MATGPSRGYEVKDARVRHSSDRVRGPTHQRAVIHLGLKIVKIFSMCEFHWKSKSKLKLRLLFSCTLKRALQSTSFVYEQGSLMAILILKDIPYRESASKISIDIFFVSQLYFLFASHF
jgi:hypothetical protein